MKARSAIKDEFKWNLKDIYESDEALFKALDSIKEKVKKIPEYKGKLSNSKKCLELFKLEEEIDKEYVNICTYSMLKRAEDGYPFWKHPDLSLFSSRIWLMYPTASSKLRKYISWIQGFARICANGPMLRCWKPVQ